VSNQHSPSNKWSNQSILFTPPRTISNTYGIDDIRYFIEGYVLHHRSQRHSPHTIRFCTERLDHLVWFLEHEGYPTTLTEITPNHLRHFLLYLSEQNELRWGSTQKGANRPMCQTTIHSYAKALRAFFRWATQEIGMAQNPFSHVPMPTLPNQWHVQTFTDEEIAAMFAAVDTLGPPFIVQRNRTMLSILLDSAVRASELLSLRVDSINPHDSMFTVTGKGGKTRTVVVGNHTRRELWIYVAQFRLKMRTNDTALFVSQSGKALTYPRLRIVFQKLKERTGIDRIRVSAHICRHSAATAMYRNGMKAVVLQEVLGHTKFDTTRKYYLSVSTEDLRTEHNLYGPLDHMPRHLREQRSKLTSLPEIPDAKVLAKEVQQSNYTAVGRRYGVSDNTIRKRLKKAGLL
jgi:integrase/recombinase XerC